MADVNIDTTISTATARAPRTLVYATDLIGYQFYVDSDGVFGYSKTTDGGATWGGQVNIDSGAATTVQAFDVWFEQWTPGDTGTKIHCWFFDTTNDDVSWRTLDTNGDTLGTQRVVLAATSAVAGRGCFISGTKTRSGYLYCAFDIDAGAERGFHRSTDSGTNWSSNLSSTFVEATLDTCSLFPASGTGDDNDCWAIYYDASATALTLKLWDSSAGSATESATIQTHTDGVTDLTGQLGYSAAVRHSDGHLILAAVSLRDNASSTHQVFDITDTSTITTKTAITSNIDDHYYPQVYIDAADTIYVAYNGKRDGTEVMDTTTSVYYTKSTDGGSTWSAGNTAYREAAAGVVTQVWCPLNGNRFAASWRVTSGLSHNKVNSVVSHEGTLAGTLDAATVSATGTAEVAGTATPTLDALTTTATTGTVDVAGTLSGTLDALAVSATGTVTAAEAFGTLAVTLDALTVTGTGTVEWPLVSGTLAATLDALTDTGTGAVDVTGSTSATLDALTDTGTGAVDVVGSLSATLGALTDTGTAAVDVVGSTSATLDALTVTATGEVVSPGITGTLDATLAALTGSATGTAEVAGSTSATLAALTDTATGTTDVVGTLAGTLAAVTVPATGTVDVVGTLAGTLDALTDTGTGTVDVVGSLSATLGALTASATGGAEVAGTLAATLDALTVTGAGAVTNGPAGELAVTLDALAGTATGTAEVAGTATPTLATLTVSATGEQSPPTGSLTATLDALTLSASGAVEWPPVTGVLAATLDAVTDTGTGTVDVAGSSTITLGGLTAIGAGTLDVVAALATTLDAATVTGTGYAAFDNPDPRPGFTIAVADSDRTVDIGARDRVASLTGSRTVTLTGHRGRPMILEE